jgi:YD repeat-containing protein
MKQSIKKMKRMITFLAAVIIFSNKANAQFDGGVEDRVIKVIGTASGGLIPLANNTSIDNTFVPGYEQSKQIKNIVRLSLFEETVKYITVDFTATVQVKIEYGHNASSLNQIIKNFSVSYNKGDGVKYDANNYFSFEGAEYVRITVISISPVSAGNINMGDVLTVENEMRVIRYYNLNTGVSPTSFSGPAAVSNPVDAVPVSWAWPANTGNNATQLEWTWLEDELAPNFYLPNTTTIDVNKLFKDNATRIDLPYNKNSFNIPLFYDGIGKLYYRIRPVNSKSNGSRQDGQWTTPASGAGICSYAGHNNDLNWQVRTSFAEEGKMKSVIEYYDGSLRSRQTVTKENVNNTVVTAEAFYDYEGRPAIQILPVPGIATVMKYQANPNLFNTQSPAQNPADIFDLQPIGSSFNSTTEMLSAALNNSGAAKYYSPANDEVNTGPNKNIPNAEGYPFAVTRYMPDATGRIMAQSGVGLAFAMGRGRETRYYYGSPAQEELDGLFGTEVGNKSHYFKNMVKDANGQMSVSYTDMHGRTIATALAGDAPANLIALDINNAANYPNQAGTNITRNLLDNNSNIEKGNSIESINSLLVPATGTYNFRYELNPETLQLTTCPGIAPPTVCYDCMYDLEISITDESGDTPPIVYKRTNIDLGGDDDCSTPPPMFYQSCLTCKGLPPSNVIQFSETLLPGSYTIRKTLTISEASIQIYKEQYLAKGLCKTEEQIIDSVYTVLLSGADCNAQLYVPCQNCLNQLGTYTTFRSSYLSSVDNPNPVPATLEAEIQTAYNSALQNCNRLCNSATSALSSKRQLMLADMMPYGGQYATETPPGSGTSMYNKYNIFSTGLAGQPFYKKPWDANKQLNYYRNAINEVDLQIHPGGNTDDYTFLNNLTKDQFTNQFVNNQSSALLPHHPEYDRLVFAETNLTGSYNWINTFNSVNTYADALAAGYIMTSNATIIDPFYTIASSLKGDMNTWITSNYGNSGFSLWQLARGQMRCQNATNVSVCFNNGNIKVPPFADITTTADKDQLWKAFRNLYASARDKQVNDYIVSQKPLADDAALIAQGYQLRFGTNSQTASQYGWTWFPPTVGATPPALPITGVLADSATAVYSDRCESYIQQWRNSLLQCGALANMQDTIQKKIILDQITSLMVAVCKHGTDQSNPYGSSTTAVPGAIWPGSFEEAVNFVFANHNIPRDYYCNPFVIEFPKPYGKGPKMAQETTTSIDSCNCANFSELSAQATEAGYNPSSLTSMNQFLQLNFHDTLTSVMHQALLNCSSYTVYTCEQVPQRIIASCYDPDPCNTIENILPPVQGVSPGPQSCSEFQQLIAQFYDSAGVINTNPVLCRVLFTNFFNNRYGVNYGWPGISTRYYTMCGGPLNVCTACTVIDTCGYSTYCHYVFRPHYLSSPQPLPDFLKCGFVPKECLTCDNLVSLTNEFKTIFNVPYNGGPVFNATNLTDEQVKQNILFARFLNFRLGYQYTWMQYAQAAAANCNAVNGAQTVICPDTHPLNDTASMFVMDTLCHHVHTLAISLGQNIYQQQLLTMQANFEKAYRAKCMAAKNIETFTVNYTNKEYHYTLYYYDMAGSLVKTVPPKGVRPDFSVSYTNQVELDKINGINNPRPHEFVTQYRTNSLGGVIAQNSPDANTSKFWYDRLGRLAVSQNAQQAIDGKYSYTLYDALGRIIEVGQKPQSTAMTQTISQDDAALNDWIVTNGGTREQVTYTVYDLPYLFNPLNQAGLYPLLTQQNLRNRVSYTATKNLATDAMQYTATFYTYDIHGNVDTLLQDYNGIGEMQGTYNRFKMIAYNYDLISGKVNMVSYQPDWYNNATNQWITNSDKFFHKYNYDAENRLTEVWTSRDKLLWERDASYSYYKYGPLSRMVLGQLQVQGVDYAYTAQGWLKGVNSTTVSDGTYDMGKDGLIGGANSKVARDIYGYALHYYDNNIAETDYKAIGGTSLFAKPNNTAFKSLYNGNIGGMSVNNAGLLKGPGASTNALPLFYNYRYDQLNRIKSMNVYKGLTANNTWQFAAISDYAEAISYDPNGNIISYNRKGSPSVPGKPTEMDDLTYNYNANNNQLKQVTDAVPATNYAEDIDNQTSSTNYTYDAIGNLKSDAAEGISNINWTVYGKIASVAKAAGTISYTYDASGNRITKTANNKTTIYVRDASGNVMSVYEKPVGGAIEQIEKHIYGSSRIGIRNKLTVPDEIIPLAGGYGNATMSVDTRGETNYELVNHLGNVLATITDKKIPVDNNSDGIIDYYIADIVNVQDYYPGGMTMPGRKYNNGSQYRYGFQNQEVDKELWSGAISFEYRVEDPRLVRFFSVDPLAANYPHNSPYAFAENRLIDGVELEGLEWEPTKDKKDNITGYNWVGYNDDGTAKKGSVANASLIKGNYSYSYSSDKYQHTGTLEIYSLDKTPIHYPQGNDNTPVYNYSFEFSQHTGYTNISVALWGFEDKVGLLTASKREIKNYWQDQNFQVLGHGVSISDNDLFQNLKTTLGLGTPTTSITSVYPETIFIPIAPEVKGASLFGKATGRIFWSGGEEAMNLAAKFGRETGGRTLEMTLPGRFLTKLTNLTSFKFTEPLWKYSSKLFANGARGEANLFLKYNRLRPNGIWNMLEKPILQNNGVRILTNKIGGF